jgi:hypothetical protein
MAGAYGLGAELVAARSQAILQFDTGMSRLRAPQKESTRVAGLLRSALTIEVLVRISRRLSANQAQASSS